MERIEIPTGVGYFNLDIQLNFDNYYLDIVGILHEPNCISFTGFGEDLYHLIFYKDGKIDFEQGDKKYKILPDTFLINGPNLQHNEIVEQENVTKYHVYFNVINNNKKDTKASKKNLSYSQQESVEILKLIPKIINYSLVRDSTGIAAAIFERIIFEIETQKFGYNFLLMNLFYEIFILFCRNAIDESFKYYVPLKSPSVNSLSYSINSYIWQHYKDITLKQISTTFSISERQVQRILKAHFNISLKKKVYEIQIQKAKMLLKETDLSIIDIANEVGFENVSYFGKLFRASEKISPNQYRKTR